MFGIRSPPRTEAPSKRSGSANAGRSSITATSKSRSRAWRAMARETWPPPAMTSWGRLVTGSTSSSCASSSGTSRAVPWRICSMAASRARSSRPAEPSVPEHPAAGQHEHPRVEPQRASGPLEGRDERHRRPAAGGVGGRRDRVDAVHRRRPRRSAAGFREDPHGAAAHEPGVPGQFFGELVFVHRGRLAGQDLAGGVDGVGLHAAAAEGAERPFRLVAGQDQLGADDLRGAALGPDHGRHGERNPGRGELLHAFEGRGHVSWAGSDHRGLRAARIYSNT